jgi:hypothetical protein
VPLLSTLVHGESQLNDPFEARVRSMRVALHHPNDFGELLEVLVLLGPKRISLEEWKYH